MSGTTYLTTSRSRSPSRRKLDRPDLAGTGRRGALDPGEGPVRRVGGPYGYGVGWLFRLPVSVPFLSYSIVVLYPTLLFRCGKI